MNKINYTIIIPHKNIPNLLKRCLDSIPKRDDLQIIVVDDCSNKEHVDSLVKISIEYAHVSFIYSETSGGGGKARNEGLKLAKGYYILFADADDFFNYCINDVLEEYKNTNHDVIFFNANSLDTDTYLTTYRCNHLNRMIHQYEKEPGKAIFQLKYCFGEPWCKFVKHQLIENNNISFSETIIHNDTRYSYLVGHYSSNIKIDNRAIYCVTDRIGSVSKSISLERLFVRTYIFAEATMFFRNNGISLYGQFLFNPLNTLLFKGDWRNCKKCYHIMKKCGMSSSLIFKGYSLFFIKRVVQIPFRIIKVLIQILK